MTKTPRALMKGSKLSNYQLLRLLRAYADGKSPSEAAREGRVSYVSVRRLFSLVRQRMMDFGVYWSLEEFLDERHDASKQGYDWDETGFYAYLKEALGRRRGITAASRGEHEAELIFRYRERTRGEAFARWHFVELLALIRLGGPLNVPLTKDGEMRVRSYRIDRQFDELRIEGLKLEAWALREFGDGWDEL